MLPTEPKNCIPVFHSHMPSFSLGDLLGDREVCWESSPSLWSHALSQPWTGIGLKKRGPTTSGKRKPVILFHFCFLPLLQTAAKNKTKEKPQNKKQTQHGNTQEKVKRRLNQQIETPWCDVNRRHKGQVRWDFWKVFYSQQNGCKKKKQVQPHNDAFLL